MDFRSTFENLKDRATDLAQAGVAQSKRLAEIAKLKTANMAEEDAIKKAYLEIGKLYYAERGMAPDPAYAALCEKITAAKVNIEENKNRIEACKAAGGVADAEVGILTEEFTAPEEPEAPGEDVPPQDPPQE